MLADDRDDRDDRDERDERERDARRKEEEALDVWAALSRGDKTEARDEASTRLAHSLNYKKITHLAHLAHLARSCVRST